MRLLRFLLTLIALHVCGIANGQNEANPSPPFQNTRPSRQNITIVVPGTSLQLILPLPFGSQIAQLPFVSVEPSIAPSECPSPSPVPSSTESPSVIPSPSLQLSSSPSPSFSQSASPSPRASETPTLKPSPFESPSPSNSASMPSSPPTKTKPPAPSSFPSASPPASAIPSVSPSSSLSPTSSISTLPTVSPSLTLTPTASTTATPSASPSETPTPSVTPSQSCPPTCRCEDPGTLLGEPSFDESELVKFGAGDSSTIWFANPYSLPPSIARSESDPTLVQYNGNELVLTAEKRGGDFFGAGFRTQSYYYGYGCVSACMKPSGVSGVISSLFTYTGPYDGIGGSSPNQNEIDIEFEGQDTTVVQFNYYVDKAASDPPQFNEHDHALGFDASLSFNVFGFRWTPWGIQWEVNGNVVHEVDNTGFLGTPVVTATTVQKVMANLWIVSSAIENAFGGPFDEASFTSTTALYKWIRYEKLDSDGCCAISPSC